MREKEYKITLTEEDKNKLEQVLKLVDIVVDMVEVEDTEQPEEKEWPQEGDIYYYLASDGTIMYHPFNSDYSSYCKGRVAVGNCFKTKEEAEFEVERLKVLTEMKKFAEPEDRKWNDTNRHWYPHYDFDLECILYGYTFTNKSNNIYFESTEKAQECVITIGKDRVKKYYLGIKE